MSDEVDGDHDKASILRIMISTDIHLGYNELDPIRGNDSFNTFEEVLSLSKKNGSDFLLLGGDLFHENRPSRK
jgi:double-strand break repair protein MRE11